MFARGQFDDYEPSKSTLNHLAFEIPPDRYAAERDRLEAFGLKPRSRQFPAMSAHALFFHDPEGHELELIYHNPGE